MHQKKGRPGFQFSVTHLLIWGLRRNYKVAGFNNLLGTNESNNPQLLVVIMEIK